MTTLSSTSIQPKTITIAWPSLTNAALNGGDIPYYYQVEWYDTTIVIPAWTIVSTENTDFSLTFTHVRSVIFVSNSNQQYRVTPKNYVGLGSVYTSITVVADREPQTMNTPTIK